MDQGHAPEPRHILSRHTLPITDLHCGLMGAQARVATSSLDQTVKVTLQHCFLFLCPLLPVCFPSLTSCGRVQVWELSSGELLLSVLFDVEIMSVTTDPCDYFLFCGGSDGNIFQVSLCSQVNQVPPPSVLQLLSIKFEHSWWSPSESQPGQVVPVGRRREPGVQRSQVSAALLSLLPLDQV